MQVAAPGDRRVTAPGDRGVTAHLLRVLPAKMTSLAGSTEGRAGAGRRARLGCTYCCAARSDPVGCAKGIAGSAPPIPAPFLPVSCSLHALCMLSACLLHVSTSAGCWRTQLHSKARQQGKERGRAGRGNPSKCFKTLSTSWPQQHNKKKLEVWGRHSRPSNSILCLFVMHARGGSG